MGVKQLRKSHTTRRGKPCGLLLRRRGFPLPGRCLPFPMCLAARSEFAAARQNYIFPAPNCGESFFRNETLPILSEIPIFLKVNPAPYGAGQNLPKQAVSRILFPRQGGGGNHLSVSSVTRRIKRATFSLDKLGTSHRKHEFPVGIYPKHAEWFALALK